MDETNAYGITPMTASSIDNDSFKVAVKVRPNSSNSSPSPTPVNDSAVILPATAPAIPGSSPTTDMLDKMDMPTNEIEDETSKEDTVSSNPTFQLSDLETDATASTSEPGGSSSIIEPNAPPTTVVSGMESNTYTPENKSGTISPVASENPPTLTPLSALAVSPEPINSVAPVPETPTVSTKTMQPKKSNKMLIILTAIILVAILAGAAYYFFIIRKRAVTTSNSSTTTASTIVQKLTASEVANTAALIDKDLAIQNGNNDISGTDLSDSALGL